MASVVSVVDPNGEWASAIGRAFVAFGSIEHTVSLCFDELSHGAFPKFARQIRLAQRIDLALELLEPHKGEECRRLSEELRRAKKLAETRNLIAHNPLVMQLHHELDRSQVFGAAVTAMYKDCTMSLGEANRFASDSDVLACSLLDASIKAFKALGLVNQT